MGRRVVKTEAIYIIRFTNPKKLQCDLFSTVDCLRMLLSRHGYCLSAESKAFAYGLNGPSMAGL